MSCKASNAASWRWPTWWSSPRRTAKTSARPNWRKHRYPMHSICFRNRSRDAGRRYSPVRRWTAADFPKYGRRSATSSPARAATASLPPTAADRTNTGCTKPSTRRCATASTATPISKRPFRTSNAKVLGDRLSSFVAARKLLDRYFGDIRREK